MIAIDNAGEITLDDVRTTHLGWHSGYVWQCPHCIYLWLELKEIEKMHTGMLWFDNSNTTLNMKIQKAVDYYHKKYGRMPDLCLVHPSMLDKNQKHLEVNKITVRPFRPVLPGHIWIGIEDKENANAK